MRKFLIFYLVVTGFGASIALAVPALVILGFFALIVPGLILTLMPTAFVYGVIFTAAWSISRTVVGDGLALLAGLVAVAAIVATAVKPTRDRDFEQYRASLLEDVVPAETIEFRGHVRFDLLSPTTNEVPGRRPRTGEAGYACDSYCLAALFTPGITSVTINKSMPDGSGVLSLEARTYRLERRPGCQSNAEINFGAIQSPLEGKYEDGKVLVSQWAMKLAQEFCLVVSPAQANPDFTVVERQFDNGVRVGEWDFGPGRLRTETVEIFAQDRVIHRAHQSSVTTLASFLHIVPTGGMENFRFGWARSTVNSKGGYAAVTLPKSLELQTNLAGKAEPGTAGQKVAMLPELRRQLNDALDDPEVTEKSPDFQVLETYFEAVGSQATDADVTLISRIVSDQRLTRFPGAWSLKLPLDQARTIYDAYTKRLAATGAPMTMRGSLLQGFVDNLGVESVRLVGPPQDQLLADPAKRLAVPEMVKALGYGNQPNGERLLSMLKQHAALVHEIRQQRQDRVIESNGREAERDANLTLILAAKSGLCLLAPEAKHMREELEQFLASGIMPPHHVDGHAMMEWDVILARMGKPIEAFRKPASMSGPEATYRRNLRNRVERWRPDRC